MVVSAVAGAITLVFTTFLTIAGVGAAFILIPVFIALGVDLHISMATALLLNSIAMVFASYRFVRKKLILWKIAFPMLIVATACSPVGAYVSKGLDRDLLLWLFTGFLVFAASMMLFYKSRQTYRVIPVNRQIACGVAVGAFAGFLGGLLGVGGGNFIVPVLVWLGAEPKNASATTSFIVIFSSFSGFIGHASLGNFSLPLLGFTATGSAIGAVLGSWLMTEKLKQKQIKTAIGVVLFVIAGRMLWNLVL